MSSAIRCRIGIALKLTGCALIHGWGRHYYSEPAFEIFPGESRVVCQSCGKHQVLDANGRTPWPYSPWLVRRMVACWGAVADPVVRCAGRLGCRFLDRHHYQACRGRTDHQFVDGRIQPVEVVDGRWVPARR